MFSVITLCRDILVKIIAAAVGSIQATKLLKNYGFKVTYHIMPGLPGSTAVKDFNMYKQLFNDERFQPDQIKFYPTVVTKGSLLYRWWKMGKTRKMGNMRREGDEEDVVNGRVELKWG